MSSTLSHPSESSKLIYEKKHHWQEQWSNSSQPLRFSVKHGGSVPVTARQQTYCKSNLEQGVGEVPAPSVLKKAKLWNDSRNYWRNTGESLEMILAWCTSPQKSNHDLKEIDTIPDASFVLSVLVRSTFVRGSLVWISLYKFKYNGRKGTCMQ